MLNFADRLRADADRLRAAFNAPHGTRTRHFVLDDLLPSELAQEASLAFASASFTRREDWREKKGTCREALPAVLRDIVAALHSAETIDGIGEVVGVNDMEGDPSLYAGGISEMQQGDFLNPHIDNSHDANRQRYRRFNLLLYVSPNWRAEYGGNLELWDEDVASPVVIPSLFNRLVVMETNRYSWHSVSPVTEDRLRQCISSYYFSKSSPTGGEYYHATSFTGRPGETGVRLWARADALMRTIAGKVVKRTA